MSRPFPVTVRRVLALLAAATLLAGCASEPPRPGAAEPTPSARYGTADDGVPDGLRSQVVAAAEGALGTPYRYGGEDRRGFDCSGLVQYSHAAAGVAVPRVTGQQRAHARPVALSRLQPGDLLFFEMEDKGRHVGIYVGDGEFIHAPSSGKRVSRASLRQRYWRNRLVAAGSYL